MISRSIKNYRKQLLSGRIDSYQMRKRLVSKEGELFWVLLHNNLIRDEQGDPQYFLSQFQGRLTEKEQECILLEIERKMAQELLRNSEKLTIAGQLAAGIAHEIRNPLTSLKGFLQLMKAGAEYREDYLNIMESELSWRQADH
ncbi:histidine kinase dimerization/phospho-acceptor domain-containing protein [Brevibacillus composti]|uniref:histidine kinase dimerization/phospho-acceptor domain-containing protein n=1 Tax=Brevibacillus composti TaxID=2796470 RepID=UPI00226B1BDF|nr:histidine kinase dimerization/phospho-acceptor domain-containing protein [Brevibacillus composti]